MASLYDLTGQWDEVFNMLEDDSVPEDCIFDTLEGIEGELSEKADNYAKIIKSMKNDADGIKEEIERLQTRKQSIINRAKWLQNNLYLMMKTTGQAKIKTKLFSFNIQKNPMSCTIKDVTKVPSEYLIPVPDKVDNKAIINKYKELIKKDPDAKLPYAEITQSEGVRIR